ncbi:MAG: DNA polymerase III subunit beta [Thiothrix sp.]|nr:DNA polymerase III subunit beta [Thiothrix sp.]HPQ97073.1 DNA polymerase III subunit beta [Thiolinea sp.]
MKLTQTRETLLEALQATLGAIEKRHTSPILENVLLRIEAGNTHWRGTDLELEIATSTPVIDAEDGEITLAARKLADICKSLPPDSMVAIDVLDNDRAVVSSGRSRFELSTLPARDYPELEDIGSTLELEMGEREFKALLENTAFAMANQDVRYYLNGLLLELNEQHIRTVSTDGHRLSLCTLEREQVRADDVKEPLQVIIPRKGVLEMIRLLRSDSQTAVRLQLSQNHLRILIDQLSFTTKLVDGRYPDYQAAVPPKGQISVEVDRMAFRDMLSRVSILSNEKFRGVRLSLADNVLTVQSNNPEQETAQDELDVNYQGQAFNIGFNVTYLLEAINHLHNESMTLQFNSPESSALLTDPGDASVCNVIMPIRL